MTGAAPDARPERLNQTGRTTSKTQLNTRAQFLVILKF
jgi:hypothetical protein